MKWSQGLCASILIDGLYFHPPVAGSNPRWNEDFSGANPASPPNALAPDWRLSPEAGRPSILELAGLGLVKPRPPAS
jgi:hypothetical protein